MYDAHVGSLQLQHNWTMAAASSACIHICSKITLSGRGYLKFGSKPRRSYVAFSHEAREVPSSPMLILDAHTARSPSTD